MERRTIHFSGHVQGVGFRYTAQQTAARHPVKGYVRNLPDGRVEVVVEAMPSEIDRFLNDLTRRMKHQIDTVAQNSEPASNEFKDFEIRRRNKHLDC